MTYIGGKVRREVYFFQLLLVMARNYFDEIINFLDTDTDIFDDDFNLAAEELTAVNVISCSFCEKTYKTDYIVM